MKLKEFLLVIICLFYFQNSFGQDNLLEVIFKFELESELYLLPNTKSYVKTTEEYMIDSLIKSKTVESFYNYDTIKYCFGNDDKFYDMVYDFCELKKVAKNKFIQTSTNLHDDDFSKEETHVFKTNERIDSAHVFENQILKRKVIGVYLDDKLIEKQYESRSFGEKNKIYVEYRENQRIVRSEKNDLITDRSIYSVKDSVVSMKVYYPVDTLREHKEFEIKMYNNHKPKEIKTFVVNSLSERTLIRKISYEYEKDTYIEREERFDIDFTKTTTEEFDDEKTIVREWGKSGKRIIDKYIYF